MERPRTVFGPFAVIIALCIGFALGRFEPTHAPQITTAELTKGSKVNTEPPPVQRLRPPPSPARLIIPVEGVQRRNLSDTWGDARSEGRQHEGIDIMAPQGTPVFAAADGRIVKFFDSVRGGTTIYQFDSSERFVYYYAHLSRRAATLHEGDEVRQGDVIAYVGMTGNAPVPHLHFEIQRLTPARNWWQADSMNPYPNLISGMPPA